MIAKPECILVGGVIDTVGFDVIIAFVSASDTMNGDAPVIVTICNLKWVSTTKPRRAP